MKPSSSNFTSSNSNSDPRPNKKKNSNKSSNLNHTPLKRNKLEEFLKNQTVKIRKVHRKELTHHKTQFNIKQSLCFPS